MKRGFPVIDKYRDLLSFQLNIAERWYDKGNKTDDIFAQFFFYFSGFNALYYLWRIIDTLKIRDEKEHIANLVNKIVVDRSYDIWERLTKCIEYFKERRPVQRMDRRLGPFEGNPNDGNIFKQDLIEGSSEEKLIALAKILYLVRCNLVHGSKSESGDDYEIIEKSIPPLRVFLEESIAYTRKQIRL